MIDPYPPDLTIEEWRKEEGREADCWAGFVVEGYEEAAAGKPHWYNNKGGEWASSGEAEMYTHGYNLYLSTKGT
jgi:hypothetical protein